MKVDSATQQVFCHRFHFTSVKVAMLHLKYWATFILLQSSILHLERFQESARAHLAWGLQDRTNFITAERNSYAERTYDAATSYNYSLNICRSIRYVVGYGMEYSGPIYLGYPIMVAWVFLQSRVQEQRLSPRQQPEYRWCNNTLRKYLNLGLCFFEKQMEEVLF